MSHSKPKRFKTADNQRGPGKVHRYVYSQENKVWYVACRSPFKDPFGSVVDSDIPITCKRCLA